MDRTLRIYNTLTRQKEEFKPLHPPFVGLYVCGPTVYNNVHLGNVRTFLTFDILVRYLRHLGYTVRYVRNITDVGHLVGDGDEGEDKIGKMARLEKLEPMEIVQRYTLDFHQVMQMFNLLPPSVEPTATGHLIEQIEATRALIDKGFAYESNGSVYFDITRYNEAGLGYGKLSGRVLEDLLTETRDLEGTDEKRNPLDFALWKKAAPEHIMQWPSPWGMGFPGWHLECSCMSTRYLGTEFDIHGGGMDLKFPHHECEVAQARALNGRDPVRYWMHSNMLTVNGQKMSKSLGNSFLPAELVRGDHPLLDQAYSPMTVRFFMLQSQYRSTLDFSNEALGAARKGYRRLANGLRTARNLQFDPDDFGAAPDPEKQAEAGQALEGFYEAMGDDLNTAVAIAHLFTLLRYLNMLYAGQLAPGALGSELCEKIRTCYRVYMEEVLGLEEEPPGGDTAREGMLALYKDFRTRREYERVDELRALFKKENLVIRDLKNRLDWGYDE
jgi:cysteinyl-tRNA synthetase